MSASRAHMRCATISLAALALLAAAPLASAEQVGGAKGHDEAAAHGDRHGAAPANEAPPPHDSHPATGARSGAPVGTGLHPSKDTPDGAAHAPAIGVRPFSGHRATIRSIKELLPKPFEASKPRQVRHPPAFAIAAPARNAIGIPLDHPPIARPVVVTSPATAPGAAAKNTGATGPAGGMALLHQGIPPTPLAPHGTGLNGTAIRQVGTGPATVGGAARVTTGIDGTSFRPKHGN